MMRVAADSIRPEMTKTLCYARAIFALTCSESKAYMGLSIGASHASITGALPASKGCKGTAQSREALRNMLSDLNEVD